MDLKKGFKDLSGGGRSNNELHSLGLTVDHLDFKWERGIKSSDWSAELKSLGIFI